MLNLGENDLDKIKREDLLQDTTKYIFEWDNEFCYDSDDSRTLKVLTNAQNNNDPDGFTYAANKALESYGVPAKIVKILDFSGKLTAGWPTVRFRTTKPMTYAEVERVIWDSFDPDFGCNDENIITVSKIIE